MYKEFMLRGLLQKLRSDRFVVQELALDSLQNGSKACGGTVEGSSERADVELMCDKFYQHDMLR